MCKRAIHAPWRSPSLPTNLKLQIYLALPF